MSDPPLLSQDEFFRHLNLQSVHFDSGQGGTGGRYMYRQALKERLRASSYAKTNYYKTKANTKTASAAAAATKTYSPQVSPCKWMTDSQRKKMFGRPKVRTELFKDDDKETKKSLVGPLMDNCHVLRHPGIKKELESSLTDKTESVMQKFEYLPQGYRGTTPSLPLPTESLQVRLVHGSPLPLHCICERPQPGREARDAHLAQEAVRKTATRALFGHGESNVRLASLGPSSVTKVKRKPKTHHTTSTITSSVTRVTKVKVIPNTRSTSINSLAKKKQPQLTAVKLLEVRSPLRNNNCQEHAKKLLRENNCHNIKHHQVTASTAAAVTAMLQCKQCGRKYKTSPCPLKSWKEAVQSSSLCETCRAVNQLRQESTNKELLSLLSTPSPAHPHQQQQQPPDQNKTCDICHKTFGKRSHMIRHMTNVHPLNIHGVDLAKFANFKTPRPPATAPVAATVRHSASSWLEPSPTKQSHLKPFISA